MVQVEQTTDYAQNGYDSDMRDGDQETHQQDWGDAIRKAVHDFAGTIGESSRQLGSAAEKLAGHSLSWVEQLALRAQQSASLSQEMAEAASRAAEDARRAAENIHQAVSERFQTEARQVLEEAASRASESAGAVAERVQAEARQVLEEAPSRASEAANAAVREVLSREGSDVNERLNETVQSASQRLSEESRQLLEEFSSRVELALTASREAAEAAAAAAKEAREAASDIKARANAAADDSARSVLDRLEADYQLLTRLVQDLHDRISGLAPSASEETMTETISASGEDVQQAAAAEPAPVETFVTPAETHSEAAHVQQMHRPEASPASEVGMPGWFVRHAEEQGPAAHAQEAETASAEAQPADAIRASESEPAPFVLDERVLLTVSPVRDFDRLLGLDSALGRIASVRNVTLADFAREEVTFRIEMNYSSPITDFTSDLAQLMPDQTFEVTAFAPGNIRLRIDARS
jgi:hypothetical protein